MINHALSVGDRLVTKNGYPYKIVALCPNGSYEAVRDGMRLFVRKDGSEAVTSTGVRYGAEFFECPDPALCDIFDSLVRVIEWQGQELRSLWGKEAATDGQEA